MWSTLGKNIRRGFIPIAVLSLVLTSLQPALVFAQDQQPFDENFYSGNDVIFYDDTNRCDSGTVTPNTATQIDDASTKARLKTILEYFTGQGLTLAAAAGIAGNIKTESASTYNPAVIQGVTFAKPAQKDSNGDIIVDTIFKPKDKQGFGLSQWTDGGTTAPRQGPLYMMAVNQKKDIIDMGLQLDYIWKELSTSYKTSTLDRIKDMTDPREATKIYMINYEGPLDQSEAAQNGRADDGEAIYNEFKSQISDGTGVTINTSVTPLSDGSTCETADSTTGGVGTADGFTFPLKTTQATIKKGVDGSVWCYNQTTNCHHDYNAADIFAETGTPIVAAKPGKVVSKTTDLCTNHSTGCNVSIKGDDGILYYYTHMSKQATVNVGQEIQAGQEIGSVGTNQTAMGTTRHLHIDMSHGDYRIECSGSSCPDDAFMNVQQYLVPAFQALPKGEEDV